MANVSSSTKIPLIYKSSTKIVRPAILFLSVLLAGTAISALLLIISSLSTLLIPDRAPSVPLMALVAGCGLLAYSLWYGSRLWLEAKKQYQLVLNDEQVVLTIIEAHGKDYSAQMAYSDIDFAEHFTVRDQEALIFHGRDGRIIDVPLWCMDSDIQPAIEFLRQHHVRTVRL